MTFTLATSSRISSFAHTIEQEFITGSAISPALFAATVSVVPDLLETPGGDCLTPIHDALNWRYVRFGKTAQATLEAALLLNEDGSTWQAKLSTPRLDRKKNQPQKYETPVGNGSRAFLPTLPESVRRQISQRYAVEVPLTGSFWFWLEAHPEIPIIWTEGGKKALSLLSRGYVAIALYGVNGGYRKQIDDRRVLIPDVQRFAQSGRYHYLAFDQDAKEKTRRLVQVGLLRFGRLLEQTEGTISVVSWDGAHGKGVDDLIVAGGEEAWLAAFFEALPLLHWQLWQELRGQLTPPAQIRMTTADLSQLTDLTIPDTGIVAIASAKGTGKTKFIRSVVNDTEAVLSATHRIALGRNLCSRLGLDWRGDLDKVHGQFITGSGYTLRVGFCVDSLLAIDPSRFIDCDLVLDEAVQVVKHLLTSSTCAKEGKRPALLARFRELVQAAKRVILADADLNNATLQYIQALRGEATPLFLIRNDYEPDPYPVTFLEARDRSAITAHLLETVRALPSGQVVFVATDSKATSQALAALISSECPSKRCLVINSQTSGGDCERDFMQAPDRALLNNEYDVIICSPSMATGVSIEAQGVVAKVYGIFVGVSATDGDMAQALSRVREPVERVVWCTRIGSNFSPISRATNLHLVKSHLQQSTTATVRLIRSSLREDVTNTITAFAWDTDPHLHLYARLAAEQNAAMLRLRDALLARLRFEGHPITVLQQESNEGITLLLRQHRDEQRLMDAEAIVAARDLTYTEITLLEQQEALSHENYLAISKYYLKDFYALDTLTPDDVLWDMEGRRRGELLSLEAQLNPDLAMERTIRSSEKQLAWAKGVCPWDLSQVELRRALREKLGLTELLTKMRNGWEWTKYDLAPYAQLARTHSETIKVALHFTIHDKVSDVQIIHQLLSQLGIVTQCRWSREVPGHEGEKLRVYSLDREHWELVAAILERRQEKREALRSAGSPPGSENIYWGGDPVVLLEPEEAPFESSSQEGFDLNATEISTLNISVKKECNIPIYRLESD